MGSRVLAAVLVAVVFLSLACRGGRFIRHYEYEEDVYLGLDGSATVVVNASLPALVALRGLDLPLDAGARLDRERVRAAYESEGVGVTRVSRPWRRDGRRFVQIRLDVRNIRTLASAKAFAWSEYSLTESSDRNIFRQVVRGEPRAAPSGVNWSGDELVGFRLHLPSRIHYHNVRDVETNETGEVERGNILTWEQRLSDRLAGRPLEMEARMDRQSILGRTLRLFAGAFGAAVLVLGAIIWWTARRGRKSAATGSPSASGPSSPSPLR
jgi:hypothetical protein